MLSIIKRYWKIPLPFFTFMRIYNYSMFNMNSACINTQTSSQKSKPKSISMAMSGQHLSYNAHGKTKSEVIQFQDDI